jgi:hypothetical protein
VISDQSVEPGASTRCKDGAKADLCMFSSCGLLTSIDDSSVGFSTRRDDPSNSEFSSIDNDRWKMSPSTAPPPCNLTRTADGALDAAADGDVLRNDAALDLCAIADHKIRSAQLAFDPAEDLRWTIAFYVADDRHSGPYARTRHRVVRRLPSRRRLFKDRMLLLHLFAATSATSASRSFCFSAALLLNISTSVVRNAGKYFTRLASSEAPMYDISFLCVLSLARPTPR